jgi:hypothetical protein
MDDCDVIMTMDRLRCDNIGWDDGMWTILKEEVVGRTIKEEDEEAKPAAEDASWHNDDEEHLFSRLLLRGIRDGERRKRLGKMLRGDARVAAAAEQRTTTAQAAAAELRLRQQLELEEVDRLNKEECRLREKESQRMKEVAADEERRREEKIKMMKKMRGNQVVTNVFEQWYTATSVLPNDLKMCELKMMPLLIRGSTDDQVSLSLSFSHTHSLELLYYITL